MKQMKKIAGFIVAAVMVLAMTFTAWASEQGTPKYTIKADNNGHTYEVYQIFTGVLQNNNLAEVKWGKNGTEAEGTGVPGNVLAKLEQVTGNDVVKLEVIKQYVNLDSTAFGTVGGANQPVLEVPAGYYLIKDIGKTLPDETDVYSTYIVKVVGNIEITPKADAPTAQKKVKDKNDSDGLESTWQDSADYDIGDEVPFQLTGTVASNYDVYGSYKFIFHDTLSEGLTFKENSVKVMVDGMTELITDKDYTVALGTNGQSFDISFENLKAINAVHAGSVITVEYTAQLNEKAVHGSVGNPNTMHLKYSNNPYGTEMGKTPEDRVTVFTYQVVINKVDSEQAPLAGADFVLEKMSKDEKGGEIWTEVTRKTIDDTKTIFTFTGLDDGEYCLKETKTPAGYNSIADMRFTINATHDENSDVPGLIELAGSMKTGEISFTSQESDGSLNTDIVNQKGGILPETGGRGTFLLYAAGAVLVLGAGALLVLKKRKK